MKKRLLTISLVFSSIFMLWGQEPTFTAKVNMDSVLLGNRIEVSFTVENVANAKIQAPEFIGFDVLSGPNYASSMQVINGEVSQSLTNSYWLEPKDVGQYFIGPGQVDTGEGLLESQPVEINVYHNPEGIIQKEEKRNTRDSWFDWPERERSWPLEPKPKKKSKKKRKVYRL